MKKTITIVIVVLVCVGFGYYLFKLSPSDQNATPGSYNSSLNTSNIKPIATPPPFDPSTDHYQGDAKAKNTFLEYGDLECPACAAYSDMLKQVPTTFPDTVFVFRYFPLTQIHPNSVEGAMAVEAAGAQGKYWEMHDILFAKQADWESLSDPLDQFATYAQQVGVSNIDQFKSDISNKKYLSVIQTDSDEALGLSLPGTPSFYFNGHLLKNDSVPNMLTQSQQWIIK